MLKISAMGFISPAWTVEQVRPIILDAIDIFGPERCRFGSNYPVQRLARSYSELWHVYAEAISDLSRPERDAMFFETATRFYRL